MTTDFRRGACPALSAPMSTGDGLLVRVPLEDGIKPAELADICRVALRHGNGMLDISARGNIQIRGLTDQSAPLLETDIRAMNLPLREGITVEVPPLAGMDPTEIADPRPLAKAIREGASGLTGLAPKTSVIVDGCGLLKLSGLKADIRLVAVSSDEWQVAAGGKDLGLFSETEAEKTAIAILRQFAASGARASGRILFSSSSPFAIHALSDDRFAIAIGPAFGHAHADELIALCNEARGFGILSVKPGFDHSLFFFGERPACEGLQRYATNVGFITSAGDPRAHIAACPGSPACGSAAIATREIASRAVTECSNLLDASFKLHVTGCAKGCAHPQSSALTLCGTQAGVSLIANGKAADSPFASVEFADTNLTLRRIADLVGSQRREGENAAACLARLGLDHLAAAATGRQ